MIFLELFQEMDLKRLISVRDPFRGTPGTKIFKNDFGVRVCPGATGNMTDA